MLKLVLIFIELSILSDIVFGCIYCKFPLISTDAYGPCEMCVVKTIIIAQEQQLNLVDLTRERQMQEQLFSWEHFDHLILFTVNSETGVRPVLTDFNDFLRFVRS